MITITEKYIESRLVTQVKSMGGLAIKLSSGGGLPDRLLLFNSGRCCFVEVKRPGERPRLLQQLRHEELRRLGFEVFVVDSVEGISEIIEKYGHDAETDNAEKEGEKP